MSNIFEKYPENLNIEFDNSFKVLKTNFSDEQRKDWFNSLAEGTYVDGDNSTIIKKNESGNIIIKSIAGTSFCSMEYDSTGSLVMQWTGIILTSK